MYADPEDPLKVGIAFRLPESEDPEEFEERLETAGLVGCALSAYSRSMDKWWESFAKGQAENFKKLNSRSRYGESQMLRPRSLFFWETCAMKVALA